MKLNKSQKKAARRAKTFPQWKARQDAMKAAAKETAKVAALTAIVIRAAG